MTKLIKMIFSLCFLQLFLSTIGYCYTDKKMRLLNSITHRGNVCKPSAKNLSILVEENTTLNESPVVGNNQTEENHGLDLEKEQLAIERKKQILTKKIELFIKNVEEILSSNVHNLVILTNEKPYDNPNGLWVVRLNENNLRTICLLCMDLNTETIEHVMSENLSNLASSNELFFLNEEKSERLCSKQLHTKYIQAHTVFFEKLKELIPLFNYIKQALNVTNPSFNIYMCYLACKTMDPRTFKFFNKHAETIDHFFKIFSGIASNTIACEITLQILRNAKKIKNKDLILEIHTCLEHESEYFFYKPVIQHFLHHQENFPFQLTPLEIDLMEEFLAELAPFGEGDPREILEGLKIILNRTTSDINKSLLQSNNRVTILKLALFAKDIYRFCHDYPEYLKSLLNEFKQHYQAYESLYRYEKEAEQKILFKSLKTPIPKHLFFMYIIAFQIQKNFANLIKQQNRQLNTIKNKWAYQIHGR